MILATARAEARSVAYALSNGVRVIVTLLAAAVLLLGLRFGVVGAVYGMALGSAIAALSLARNLTFRPAFRGSLSRIGPLLKTGVSLVPANLASWVSNLSDRYLLLLLGSSASVVGLYSAGYRLGALITTLFVGPFHTAFLPMMLKYQSSRQEGSAYRDASRAFLVLGSLVVCGLQAVAVPAVSLLAGPEFAGAERVVGTVSFGCLLMGAAMLMTPSALTAGRPHLLSIAFGSGAVVNVGMNLILIPEMGMVGAGIATAGGYAVVLAAMLRVTPDDLRPPDIGHTLVRVLPVMAAVTIPSSFDYGTPALQWAVSGVLSVIGVLALVMTGILSRADALQTANVVRTGLGRVAHGLLPRQGFVGPKLRVLVKALSRIPAAIHLLVRAWIRRVDRRHDSIGAGNSESPYLNHLAANPAALEVATRGADRIVQGDMITFGHEWRWGSGRDWHLDPISGRRWALIPSAMIDVNRVVRDSDVQCVWETSRLEHVWRGALEYTRTGDERFARWSIDRLESWSRWNPVGWGVNWIVTMEVALRAVAIAEVRASLRGSAHWSPFVERRTLEMLADHAEWSMSNLEYRGSGTQNHYLAALVGILALAAHLPGWGRLQDTIPDVYMRFLKCIEHQVLPDGVDFENSLGYHLLVCELVCHGVWACSSMSLEIPHPITKRLQAMFVFARAMEFADGSPVAFGDDDDDFLGPAGAPHFSSERPSLDSRLAFGARALEVGWPSSRPEAPLAFTDAGVYVLGGQELRAVINAMQTGVCGTGPHRHNDALSFCLEVGGNPIFVDPGTYRYQCDGDDRDRYRSTAAHNTVQVDDCEQNAFVGPFALAEDRIAIHQVEAVFDEGLHQVSASHNGFVTETGLTHTRVWRCEPLVGLLTVQDSFAVASGSQDRDHRYVARLHLAPGLTTDPVASPGGFTATLEACSVSAEVSGGRDVSAKMVSSCYSPNYRREVPSGVLEVSWIGPPSSTLTTVVVVPKGTRS
jgi:hypothetical protein